MSVKPTIEEVRDVILCNSDCKLLSKTYIDSKTDLKLLCSCGAIFYRRYGNIKHRNIKKGIKLQCRECFNMESSERLRDTIENVSLFVKNNSNSKLMSNSYVNEKSKLTFMCECGNEFTTSFDSFKYKNKRICDECVLKKRIESRAHKHEDFIIMRDYFKNYEFITKYKNYHSKIKVRHMCGYEWETHPVTLLKTEVCPNCFGRKGVEYDEVINEIKKLKSEHVVLITSKEDFKNGSHFILGCTKHNIEWNSDMSHLKRNVYGCTKCATEARIGEGNHAWNGGVSKIHKYLRRNITQWKLDSAKACNYKCVLTGEKFDDIHHRHAFPHIVDEVFLNLGFDKLSNIGDYSQSQIEKLNEELENVHSKYGLGLCLKEGVHLLFHKTYGFGGNTVEQWNEFEADFKDGKYIDGIDY